MGRWQMAGQDCGWQMSKRGYKSAWAFTLGRTRVVRAKRGKGSYSRKGEWRWDD